MKDFKYCIWYSPHPNHPWHYFANGFPAHMSIKTGLNLSQALNLFSKLKKINTDIAFDNLRCNEEDGFHAMYYTIKDIENKPAWWPKNPHMSFLYKYNQNITTNESNYLYNNMPFNKGTLTNFHVVLCKGHYTKWKMIASK
jgi:hypothetical protein